MTEKYSIYLFHLGGGEGLPISQKTYEKLSLLSETRSKLGSMEVLFQIVVKSMIGFEKSLLDYCIKYRFEYENLLSDGYEIKAEVNHQLLNVLSAIRMYHDQRKSLLDDLPTINQPEIGKLVQDKFSEIYDRSLTYRIMENLRNRAQHGEILIRSASFSSKLMQSPPDVMQRTTVNPTINLAKINKKKFQSPVRK